MKMKSLAMLAVSGLVAASMAYIAPSFAADDSAQFQNGSDFSQGMDAGSPVSDTMSNGDNGSANSGPGSDSNTDNNSNSSNSDNNGSANGADQGSPDTATGDDDY